jgi:hypothetical protein
VLPNVLAATATAGVTACGAGTPGIADDDVWYSFTTNAVSGINHTITVVGVSTYNPVLQVYSGTPGALVNISCVNASGNGGTETYSSNTLLASTVYYFRVYHSGSGAANGNFEICVTAENTWTGAVSSDWNDMNNWSDATVPNSSAAVMIPVTGSDPVLSASATCGKLTITTGEIVSLNGNSLTISGAISGLGTIMGDGSISVNGTGTFGTIYFDQTTPGTTNKLTNLTVNRSGQTITLGNAVQVSGVVTPTDGTLATGGNLTLLSTATGDASIAAGSGSYITGNVTVQRFVPGASGRKYRYLAAPFATGPTIASSWQQQIHITGNGTGGTACPTLTAHSNGFDASTYNKASMLVFDEVNATVVAGTPNVSGATIYANAWTGVANTASTNLVGGKGYSVFVRGARAQGCGLLDGTNPTPNDVTLSATGTIATGNFNYAVTYSSSNGEGWNLVGNPYPSAIDWNAGSWTKTNLDASIWIYRPSNDQFAVYNGVTGTNGGSNIIPSGQAFFVKANAASPALVATEGVKTSSYPSTLLLKNKPFEIRLTLANSLGKTDESVLSLNRELTDGFDHSFDAEKMNNPSNVNIYSMDGLNKKYAINGIAVIEDGQEKVIPLGIGTASAGNYSLNLNAPGLPNYYQVFLRDHYLHSEVQLMVGSSLTQAFSVNSDSASFGNLRFDLFVKNNRPHSTGLNGATAAKTEVNVYPNPTLNLLTVSIKQQGSVVSSLVLFNSLGQAVKTISHPQSEVVLDLGNFESGIYFLQVNSENEAIKTIKVVKN